MQEANNEGSASRVGERIRSIREAQKMTQAELGEKVGLSADRIQKYENGFRKPKADMLKQIADALKVNMLALTDPVTENYFGVMQALFEMEKKHGLTLKNINGQIVLSFDEGVLNPINGYLKIWEAERQIYEAKMKEYASDEEREKALIEYDMWKWNFPDSIADGKNIEYDNARKEALKEQISLLQKKLDALNGK